MAVRSPGLIFSLGLILEHIFLTKKKSNMQSDPKKRFREQKCFAQNSGPESVREKKRRNGISDCYNSWPSVTLWVSPDLNGIVTLRDRDAFRPNHARVLQIVAEWIKHQFPFDFHMEAAGYLVRYDFETL